ncbi:hypothetical protein M433DRAFT_72840 [Acidomyces richmondensis BFW]|nr:MAG: hypothetical protein FE78DRAFT_75667 [Acidomyces sp. 'richmondensis']KYG42905.1 hypothetical protein M433DRAFT_72840 [Acidomyces richmondensis BFW]
MASEHAQQKVTGAHITALALKNLGIDVVFGLTGYPITAVAEAAIDIGIRFIGFRNEQSASYAASAYGYLTGRPGVCLVVGGPGVVHAIAGLVNSNVNCFPMLLIAGSSSTETHTKGDFQEMDAVAMLSPHVKIAVRPSQGEKIADGLKRAYRLAVSGLPGTAYFDIPANFLHAVKDQVLANVCSLPPPPVLLTSDEKTAEIAAVIKSAQAPLVVIGKGAAYACAETAIRQFIDSTRLPFLTSPMGIGVVPSSHNCNTSSARSTALRYADVVLVLGARLNWILHFGEPPKWNASARFIQVDVDPGAIGHNTGDPDLGVVTDVKHFIPQLLAHLAGWKYPSHASFRSLLAREKVANENVLTHLSQKITEPLKFERAYTTIKRVLDSLSPPEDGRICYIAEGARTMDTSRSFFGLEHPRLRLDAGTHGTMGVGMGYAIAAWEAYNGPHREARPTGVDGRRKKIVAIVGDSAFGFSGMEVETMARYGMDVLIFVMNNGGVYHGHADSQEEFERQREATKRAQPVDGLRSWSLGYETKYEMLADAVGGKGYLVRTDEELARATEIGFNAQVWSMFPFNQCSSPP